jgi:hypothetical protein
MFACTGAPATLPVEVLPQTEPPAEAAAPTEALAEASATPADLTATPVQPDQFCVNCHTNPEILQSLAEEPEPEETASSGEG